MKNSIEAAGWILVLFLVFTTVLTGFMKTEADTLSWTPLNDSSIAVPATLHVPLVGQIGTDWCWAACSEMVTGYYHKKDPVKNQFVEQCAAVQKQGKTLYPQYATVPCSPPDSIPDWFDQVKDDPGSVLEEAGYRDTCPNSIYTKRHGKGADTTHAISYLTLAKEFTEGRPVIFTWRWVGVAGSRVWGDHYLVAEGIPQSRYSRVWWVSVNDPEPQGYGHHCLIIYSEYANVTYASLQPYAGKSYSGIGLFMQHCGDILHIRPSEATR